MTCWLIGGLNPSIIRDVKRWVVVLGIVVSSVSLNASRVKGLVQFNLVDTADASHVPFVVIAPETFRGEFVRFVHPFNGKSAVAKVIKKEGAGYKTNIELGKAIGIQSTVARVFIEDVY